MAREGSCHLLPASSSSPSLGSETHSRPVSAPFRQHRTGFTARLGRIGPKQVES